MLQRLMRTAILLLVAIAILSSVVGILVPLVWRSVRQAIGPLGPSVGAGSSEILLVLFVVGLAYRALRWSRDHDPRAARARQAARERVRLSVRRPAEGVPLAHARPEPPPDPDPALPVDEE